MSARKITILLVEDDMVDAEAIERGFKRTNLTYPIVRVSDGIEALKMLRGTDTVSALPRPYVILLDLNMPRLNGIEFLAELRSDPELCNNVVFVLTTSDAQRDKLAAYEKQAAAYIVKSKAGDDFINLIELLDHYLRVVELPPSAR